MTDIIEPIAICAVWLTLLGGALLRRYFREVQKGMMHYNGQARVQTTKRNVLYCSRYSRTSSGGESSVRSRRQSPAVACDKDTPCAAVNRISPPRNDF